MQNIKGKIMINLLYTGNYKVFDNLLLSLMSVANNTRETLNVYLLTSNLSELNEDYLPFSDMQIAILKEVLNRYNPNNRLTVIELKNKFKMWVQQNLNKENFYTPYAMLRLFADKVKELPNKVIYLDCDIMAKQDINRLFVVDVDNYDVAVVRDRYAKYIKGFRYFNSGVMLMNMRRLKANNSFEQVRNVCATKKYLLPDQTALNKVIRKKLFLPRWFNEQKNPRQNTVLQHFSNRVNWIPFKLIKIKQSDVDKVHKKYKIFDYDDIYEQYYNLKEEFKF